MVLTKEEKQAKYKAGQYLFPAPPVPTVLWNDGDWINYIDLHGIWL